MKVTIYGLINPINAEIFYIGRTCKPLDKRLKQHLSDSNNRKKKYIINLIRWSKYKSIKIIPLAIVDYCDAKEIELFFINKYKNIYNLTNIQH